MTSPAHRPSRLGEILVRNGTITEAQLDHALTAQRQFALPIGETLMRLGYVTDPAMRQALGQQMNVPYLDLDNVVIDRALASLIDRAYAKKHVLMPVTQVGNVLTVAMDDPTSSEVVDELAAMTGATINVVTSSAVAIRGAFRRIYEEAPAEGAARSAAPAVPAPADIDVTVDWHAGAATIATSGTNAAAGTPLSCAFAVSLVTEIAHALHDARETASRIHVRVRAKGALGSDRLDNLSAHVTVSGRVSERTVRRTIELTRAKFSAAWDGLPSGPSLAVSHEVRDE